MSHRHDHPLRNLLVLRQKVDAFAGELYDRHPTRFACRAGCDGCCSSERVLSDLEFDAVAAAVRALSPELRARLAARASPEGACSLLLEGRCAVYYERPIVCRSHGLPLLMEGLRDVCPLNFTDSDAGEALPDLEALPPTDLLSVDTLTTILVSVNALYCQETGGDADRRRPVSALFGDQLGPVEPGDDTGGDTLGRLVMSILQRVRAGFDSLEVDESFRSLALENLERWLESDELAEYRPQLEALIEAEAWDLLLDSFYQVIPFGTGGRRGPVGLGPNRINPQTIATSIQGHSTWLARRRSSDALSVVIAYDVRCFRDARGLYRADLPSPIAGLSSRDFAERAAGVYAANGVKVHMLPRGSETFVSTPELSFAIRYLDADGGLNISASHNPADDNGAKIYNHLGGQEVPPHDEDLAREVAGVSAVRSMTYEQGVEAGLIVALGPEVHAAYIQTNLDRSLRGDARGVRIVFTGLHGTGTTTVVEVLRQAGFQVDVEPTQASFDGAFPNVPFGIPNPEVAQSMDRAVAMADRLGADLVMACDPDADRLGLVVRHPGGWRFMNGNEMAALVVRYGLTARSWPRPPIVIKTEVTSSLIARVARARGAKVVGHLLVGFKYIGEGLRLLEEVGNFYSVEGRIQDFLVGVEESHGVLVTSSIRDKDAAGGALWLAEAASLEAARGRTLVDALEDCWREVGYVRNALISTVMRGATGRSRIQAIQASIRESPPTVIGGMKVTNFHDRADPRGPFGRIRSGTDAASRDVLVFELGDTARVILRPSGTEPKNKVYAEYCGGPDEPLEIAVPRVDAACQDLAEAFVMELLGRVDIHLPRWALRVSGLVAVEQKQHFAEVLMPGLVERIGRGEPAGDWLSAELVAYGRDASGLVAPGVEAWLEMTDPEPGVASAIQALFAL